MYPLAIAARAAEVTLRISLPTIWDEWRQQVDPRTCDARLEWWAARLLRDVGASVTTVGREHLALGESYIVASNHQSHYDIPAAYAAFGSRLRMAAKTELFRIPFMGAAMRASGFIELDRSNRRRALASLDRARARLLADGTSLWIAPEGTRSRTGELGEFRKGGFHLALKAGLKIVPMSIQGTGRIHSPSAREITRGCAVSVTLGPPIDTCSYGRRHLTELMTATREAIASHLPTTVSPNQTGDPGRW